MRPRVEEVRIQGLGVIDEAVLELSPGFTVVTGETGAGKTMVVTGLGLLFGGRADPARVRPGADKALVEGTLVIEPEGRVAQQVADVGGDVEDGQLIISRSVSTEGRSRAWLGGRSVPVGTLTYIADDLVAVHGQMDQQRLLQPGRQRAALDRYAGDELVKPLRAYEQTYKRHRQVGELLQELTVKARERAQEADVLRFGLEEIEKVEPRSGEDAELKEEAGRLSHADALRTAATTAHTALLGDPMSGAQDLQDAVSLVGQAKAAVESVRDFDPALAGLADRLAEAGYLISDVATELAAYAESVEADPARLAAVQERRSLLTGLTRKYGEDVAAVLAWAQRAAARLTELDGDDERIEELTREHAELTGRMKELAGELTVIRQAAAERFGDAVTAELTALAMPYARVSVAITPGEFGPHGADEVELRLASHPAAPPLPLTKGASGGELSRVMLAIEVVFAGADPVPTFVFDEVDAGVGGKAAVEIGRRLAKLARTAQVIVVTHLPQVAAFADQHLVVEKASDGSVVRSGVVALTQEARARELSRMLAGLEDSELGRAHAAELLSIAAADKAAWEEEAAAPAKRRAGSAAKRPA
ncbi:DNA repair protein RecN [Microbispora sp. ATCC PTA-5024]|uniref:DNA repair protein RecN n=1 Tax=Microbispora sp. ATCC PTA-5024 TaxID=316330 RepID=UPI0003DC880B|nr:DNA repair protein RecN [Microbispora sp. ATCC PTA-5024]ETK38195.1 DNA repair protein RecN [Microbispora sp. ATCC PTA-5024]